LLAAVQVRWDNGDDDEWVYLPEETFEIWDESAQASPAELEKDTLPQDASRIQGAWVKPEVSLLRFLLEPDRLAARDAAKKARA
jgi:hypothetical protein